jgi:ATP/maltotriose-dependent transcriptional regulator MalT
MAKGLSNKEISSRLHIATETVSIHACQNIYRKLDARSRTAALKAARVLGLVAGD